MFPEKNKQEEEMKTKLPVTLALTLIVTTSMVIAPSIAQEQQQDKVFYQGDMDDMKVKAPNGVTPNPYVLAKKW
jgi:hypothetical protein